MKNNLGMRLFVSYLIVILIGAVVLVIGTQISLPGAYGRHLGMMEQMLNNTSGGMQMYRDLLSGSRLFNSFRTSFNDALIWAGLAAILAGLVVSFLVTRSLLAPIHAMTVASRRISEGHYGERVKEKGSDELGKLAGSFNSMAVKLEQVETMRRQLIGDVSHELRTPLSAIKGSMEGLMDQVLPATPETYNLIYKEADRLSHLVDDLQELSRVESGAFHLNLKPTSIEDLVDFTYRQLSPQFKAKGVSLSSNVSSDLPLVQVDENRMDQVMINLVGNALQYTPRGGHVEIMAGLEGHEIQVSVTDSGIGIPAEHLPHIFDRFYRVDKSRSRQSGGGSGIGLTIARYLIEAHGGRLWVESEGKNEGSVFKFTLPQKVRLPQV